MKEEENIELVFCPDSNELKEVEEGVFKAKIVDAELDVLECTFIGNDCVNINTKDYAYLELTYDNLRMLIEFIEEAEI